MAYEGYSAIIYNDSQVLVRMSKAKEDVDVRILCNGKTEYRTVDRDAMLILSRTEMRGGREYGLLSMQSAVMLGCRRPSERNWMLLRDGKAVFFERCLPSCSTHILLRSRYSLQCSPNSPLW